MQEREKETGEGWREEWPNMMSLVELIRLQETPALRLKEEINVRTQR